MTLSPKQLKTITGLLNAFVHASFRDGAFDFDYDQTYENLASEVFKISEIKEYYDDDLFHWIIENQITRRIGSPRNFDEKEVNDVLEIVLKDLLRNIAHHVIVVPIPRADLNAIISFGNYMLLPHYLKRDEKIEQLARFSGKKYADAASILEHTEKSRSPDFLKYPLLCIKEKQQSATIHFRALNMARLAIYAITTYYYAYISLENQGLYSSMASLIRVPQASHIAILAKDNWRQRHNPLDFDPSMRFRLHWLAEKNHQRKLLKFIRALILAEKPDKLRLLFLNALILFNEALNQNNSIATLMIMTSAESLLTQTRNEKRLRLAAILPRLVKVKGKSVADLSEILTELYLKRNDFVHAGRTITIMYSDKKDKNSLEVAKVAVAMLLLDYPAIEQRLLKKLRASGKPINKNNLLTAWQNDIDIVFENIIKGNAK